MATHKSAEKRHRQSIKRRDRNRYAKGSIRTEVKKALSLAKDGDFENADKSVVAATSLMDKAVIHGVLHKNNARRRISRLTQRVAQLKSA